MSFGLNLKALISKATDEYKDIATKDPIVESTEDGTSRGEVLDRILAQQAVEKAALWDKLYQLEHERFESMDHVVFGPPVPKDRKELETIMTLDQHIVEKLDAELEKLNLDDRPNDDLLEIEYRDKLQSEVNHLEQTLVYLNQELKNIMQASQTEQTVLEECIASNKLLLQVESHYTDELEDNQKSTDRLAAEFALLQKKYVESLQDISDFLDEYYPPHPVDSDFLTSDECDLKKVIEHLLNRAFTHPENPYIALRPGTYWSPYIETLINARIAHYHPEDQNLLGLTDHRL
ncbi:uncharacterized protein EV154DRAFT_454007, partial [Mucor mucedo]|uniref:uncharacterized protein n=1 Tax=Mucor mucedo TaxID=29922 RepID=UPI0022211467